jgi:hypothetical protein
MDEREAAGLALTLFGAPAARLRGSGAGVGATQATEPGSGAEPRLSLEEAHER